MAPEYFIFFIFLLLVLIFIGTLALSIFIKKLRLPAAILSIIFLIAIGFIALEIRQQYFLNEPMAMASWKNDIHAVETLLKKGASPDSFGVDFVDTALTYAIKEQNIEIINLLIEYGANLEIRNSDGKTAMDIATEINNEEILEILLNAQIKK
jgi:hypothetical protein